MAVLKYTLNGVDVFELLSGPPGPPGPPGVDGTTNHNELSNVGGPSDDHTQYALADGSRGAFATPSQGTKADTAVQPDATYAVAVEKISVLTQVQYDGIGTKDQNTLYLIV